MTKTIHKNYPKTFKMLPKWQNFAKSGHTASEASTNVSLRTCVYLPTYVSRSTCVYLPIYGSLSTCVYLPTYGSLSTCVYLPMSHFLPVSTYQCLNSYLCLPTNVSIPTCVYLPTCQWLICYLCLLHFRPYSRVVSRRVVIMPNLQI